MADSPNEGEEVPQIPFDDFSQSLIDIAKKWTSSPSRFSLTATPQVIAAKNPFRIYLRILSDTQDSVRYGYGSQSPRVANGFPLLGQGTFVEYYPSKDGPVAAEQWDAVCVAGGDIYVIEVFYRGDTTLRR